MGRNCAEWCQRRKRSRAGEIKKKDDQGGDRTDNQDNEQLPSPEGTGGIEEKSGIMLELRALLLVLRARLPAAVVVWYLLIRPVVGSRSRHASSVAE